MSEIANEIVKEYKIEQYYKKKYAKKRRKQSMNFEQCMKHRCDECKYNKKCSNKLKTQNGFIIRGNNE